MDMMEAVVAAKELGTGAGAGHGHGYGSAEELA